MILNNDGNNPTGQGGYIDILGGCGDSGATYVLSAYFLCPFEDAVTTTPKWWELWKSEKTHYATGERWERKSCMLYEWQVNAIFAAGFDIETNQSMQALVFVLGGCNSGVYGVQLEIVGGGHSQYVKTTGVSK